MKNSHKAKKITAIVLMLLGIIIFILAMYAKGRVTEARENVKKTSGMFSENPVNKQITGALENKIGSYDSPIFWMTVGGIVIFGIGLGCLCCKCRKHK